MLLMQEKTRVEDLFSDFANVQGLHEQGRDFVNGLELFPIRDAPVFVEEVLGRFFRPLLEADGILGDHAVFGVGLAETHQHAAQGDEIAFFDFNLE